jgi:hypothetical protein
MPAAESSLRITEAYRARLFGLRSQLERRAETLWPTIDGLDDFTWTNKAAAATQNAQREAVALTGAYLTAFLTSEVGTRTRGPILDTRRYSGLSRDGRPLRDALRSPMIGVRFKLKEGATPEEALAYGLNRAKRMVSVDYDHAHRTALLDGLAADERFQGWQRAVTGTCGACAGDIAVEVSTNLPSIPLQVHPNCQCVTEPVVARRTVPASSVTPSSKDLGEVAALESYQRTYHSGVNGLLRSPELADLYEDTPMPGVIDAMDETFSRVAPTGESMELWRGVPQRAEELFGDDLVGKVITDPGFASTTTKRAEGFSFATEPGVVGDVWHITTRPGVKAIRLPGDEGEVLLNRGTRWLIKEIRQEGKNRVIEAEVF